MIQVNISNKNEIFESSNGENDLTSMEEMDVVDSSVRMDGTNELTSDEFQLPNFSVPPPKLNFPPPAAKSTFFRPFTSRPNGVLSMPQGASMPSTAALSNAIAAANLDDFDGKRLRKSVMRKTVDYNSSIIRSLENRVWQRDFRDRRSIQPDVLYYPDLMPPPNYIDNPMNCITTRFVKTATNKIRCPIFCMAWTPEGRRLVTGGSSGEFTLWNGLTFNFETILQAHDTPVRSMVWSHNDNWMVTGDHAGYVKYWQSNMNNVKMFQAHKEALRGISFSPSDSKFVTCSDDGTLRIWDFTRCFEERVLRGHGADVKCVHWHPQKALIVSGSKDNQQPVKLWDPKSGSAISTIHAHKATVMDLKWNDNGNWLVTASRDHLLKLFDIRRLNQEVQTFRGHKKEASIVIWHPIHEGMFVSGGSDGSVMFWHVGTDKEIGAIEQAHDSIVWTMAWHPLGHILCTGSNDHTSKFWTRNRPGDQMRDKYNLNILPVGVVGCDDGDIDEQSIIPGMDLNLPNSTNTITDNDDNCSVASSGDNNEFFGDNEDERNSRLKKLPYCKPIPRHFLAQWNDTGSEGPLISNAQARKMENIPGSIPTHELRPTALIVYGVKIKVYPNSRLYDAIRDGSDALNRLIRSGDIEELTNVLPYEDGDIAYNSGSDYYDPTIDTPLDDDMDFDQRNLNDSWTRALNPRPLQQFPPFIDPPLLNENLDEDFRFNNGPSTILPKDYPQQQAPQPVPPPSLLNLNLLPPNGMRFPFSRPVSLPPTSRAAFQMPRPNFPLAYPTRHGHAPFSKDPSW